MQSFDKCENVKGCILVDATWIIRSFVCNTKRPSVKQSIKLQVSSNFQIYPWGVKLMALPPPHSKLPVHWVNSSLFNIANESPFETVNLQENIWKYQCIEKTYRYQRQMNPPFKTVREQSELLAFQCDQWQPIRNSQLIGKYKEK